MLHIQTKISGRPRAVILIAERKKLFKYPKVGSFLVNHLRIQFLRCFLWQRQYIGWILSCSRRTPLLLGRRMSWLSSSCGFCRSLCVHPHQLVDTDWSSAGQTWLLKPNKAAVEDADRNDMKSPSSCWMISFPPSSVLLHQPRLNNPRLTWLRSCASWRWLVWFPVDLLQLQSDRRMTVSWRTRTKTFQESSVQVSSTKTRLMLQK